MYWCSNLCSNITRPKASHSPSDKFHFDFLWGGKLATTKLDFHYPFYFILIALYFICMIFVVAFSLDFRLAFLRIDLSRDSFFVVIFYYFRFFYSYTIKCLICFDNVNILPQHSTNRAVFHFYSRFDVSFLCHLKWLRFACFFLVRCSTFRSNTMENAMIHDQKVIQIHRALLHIYIAHVYVHVQM